MALAGRIWSLPRGHRPDQSERSAASPDAAHDSWSPAERWLPLSSAFSHGLHVFVGLVGAEGVAQRMHAHLFADAGPLDVLGDNCLDRGDVERRAVFGQEQRLVIQDQLSRPMAKVVAKLLDRSEAGGSLPQTRGNQYQCTYSGGVVSA